MSRIFLLVIFLLLGSCASRQIVEAPKPPMSVLAKAPASPRVALVLGSGGARGYAHLGVLRALEEAKIPVDVIVGSSAGSIIATLYADNQSSQKTYDILMPAGFWDFADIGNLSGEGGVVKGYQLQNFLMQHMAARSFDQLHKKVIIATTDMVTGELFAIDSGPIAQAVLASSAIPGAIRPVQLSGHTLIDGGVISPVPVELAKKLKPKIIIAVDLSTKTSTETPRSAIGIMDSAVYIMGKQLTKSSLANADVVISPKVGNVNIFDISKKHEMYLAGLDAARKEVPKIRKLLGDPA